MTETKAPEFHIPGRAATWGYRPNASAIAEAAAEARRDRKALPAVTDQFKTELLLIDMQRDFCHPEGTLYVGGRSKTGAMDDVRRVSDFIYRNLNAITRVTPTLDTHVPMQVFFTSFWRKEDGSVPAPFTVITTDDVRKGCYVVSPDAAASVPWDVISDREQWAKSQGLHYVEALEKSGRYSLILWPYHCVSGTEGHSLAGLIQEAFLYHGFARGGPNPTVPKGENTWTENYSVFGPEADGRWDNGADLIRKSHDLNEGLMSSLLCNDAVIVAGEASSHCVMSSVDDLLAELSKYADRVLRSRIYILRDCMSPVVTFGPDGKPIPGLDFTQAAENAFRRWEDMGAHVVDSTTPMSEWPEYRASRRPAIGM